jgi:hypothetical protein
MTKLSQSDSSGTAVSSATSVDAMPTRHCEYYFEDGNLVIQVSVNLMAKAEQALTVILLSRLIAHYSMFFGLLSHGIQGYSKIFSPCLNL